MKFENIHKRASHILRIVEAWQKGGNISRIERDIALEELRHLYSEISDLEANTLAASAPVVEAEEPLVVTAVAAPVATEATAVAPVAAPSEAEQVVEIDDDILDIDALLGITPADGVISTPEAEPVVEVVVKPELSPEPTPEPTPEPEAVPMSDGKLFAEEDIPMGKRSERKIVSLYATSAVGATAAAAATTVAAQTAEPIATPPTAPEVRPVAVVAEEQPKRLMDVLGGGKEVLADRAAKEEMPTTPFNRITDLRKAIGINDKFLMIKDLFGGNAELYNTTIDRLNAFDDLDDCMIYIAENFAWNPDSAGAKLLVSLIERKLG